MNEYRPWPELGAAIRRIRRAQDMTQGELAERAGFSTPYISNLERDQKNPPLSTLARIADGLGITLVELFRQVEHEERTSS